MKNNTATTETPNCFTTECVNLLATSLTPEWHARTCNYWYTVTSNCCPHIAFNQLSHLVAWAEQLGLTFENEFPAHGEFGNVRINGKYRKCHHLSYDKFYALPAFADGKILSNGQYTLARFTRDEDGIVTVHELNPNCKYRPVFDYAETRAAQG